MSTIRYRHYVGGSLTDCDSTPVLSDSTGAYGVKRNDTDAVVVADGQALTRDATGTYSYTFTDPANDLEYTVFVEAVYNGETDFIERIFDGPATSAVTSDVEWTVNTLTDQIRGELDMDENASGGTVPPRLKNLVKQCGVGLWRMYDWRFKLKIGTLTCVVGNASYDPASDFHKMSQRWLNETSSSASYGGLLFTENPIVWQQWYDLNTDQDNAIPRMAIVQQKSGTTHDWEFVLDSPADDTYSYKYWYSVLDPWAASDLVDTSAPAWPLSFSEGWHLHALYRCQKAFRSGDDWKDSKKDFEDWLKGQVRENDETITTSKLEPTINNYGDFTRSHSIDPSRVFPAL